ncbi:hypothetical protein FHG87_025336 [Trinorchestia longiramus]|nr:hypothetical protein FHG87_025336 [Trinorchestia longiramus]
MGYRTFSGFTMDSPTGSSTITGHQRNPNLDFEEHSMFHKQRCMATKEPRSQSFVLFYLVHFGDKGLSYSSHFSRVPQNKAAKAIGSNSTKKIPAAYDAFVNRLRAVVRNKGGHIE